MIARNRPATTLRGRAAPTRRRWRNGRAPDPAIERCGFDQQQLAAWHHLDERLHVALEVRDAHAQRGGRLGSCEQSPRYGSIGRSRHVSARLTRLGPLRRSLLMDRRYCLNALPPRMTPLSDPLVCRVRHRPAPEELGHDARRRPLAPLNRLSIPRPAGPHACATSHRRRATGRSASANRASPRGRPRASSVLGRAGVAYLAIR